MQVVVLGVLDGALHCGITYSMKVAVSIPDPVFNEAEWLARELNTSRSEIYARALAAFIGEHVPDRVTRAMNEAIEAAGDDKDDFAAEAVRRTLRAVEW